MSKIYNLLVPSYEKLKAEILEDLVDAFEVLHCDVVDCPDLSQAPFSLSTQGLCGNPVIVDVGGIGNLLPTPKLSARFDLTDVISNSGFPNRYICGAGAGPFHEIGVNCEIVADAKYEDYKILKNKSMLAKIINNENISFPAQSTKFGIIGQFLCSNGDAGKVLKITAERRMKDGSIIDFIRDSLNKHYGTAQQPVGLGGVILTECGEVKIHVMPDFSKCPLDTDSKVVDWLHFFQVPTPFVAVGEMVSHDPLNLGLRLEHFHGFTSNRHQAGHFHQDVTPEVVKYTCYFVIGENLLRQDAA